MTAYGKITVGLIAAWFVFALSASALHVFVNPSQQIALSVALAAGIPLIVFFAWLAASQNLRKFALSLNPRVLTSWQTVRLLGVVFVILEGMQLLPARFALSAGYGDIFIGATAWFAATRLAKPANRALFILWQTLGIFDLVSAVALGITAQFVHSPGPSMYLMTVLPLSLIPTFLVPLFMMFHVISIAQASQWREPAPASQGAKRSGRIGSAAA
jgi:hypothetical protein